MSCPWIEREPTNDIPLTLASGSPRRRALLAEFGVPFRVVVSDAPEELGTDGDAETQAVMLAARKAQAVASGLTEGLVLGADTIVTIDGEMLGKPRDDADAARCCADSPGATITSSPVWRSSTRRQVWARRPPSQVLFTCAH